jgi:hypothetical protein
VSYWFLMYGVVESSKTVDAVTNVQYDIAKLQKSDGLELVVIWGDHQETSGKTWMRT